MRLGKVGKIKAMVGAAAVMGMLSNGSSLWATPVTGEIFYTRFFGSPNVKSVSVNFDGTTFTLGTPASIGTTAGADGIAGNPQNPNLLLVGGQGPQINTIHRNTGVASSTGSIGSVFHLEVPDNTTVLGSGIPGGLVRHTIAPGGALSGPTAISLSGDNTTLTQVITTPSGFFYTSSGPGGFGHYGTLTFDAAVGSATSAVTDQLHGPAGTVGTANLPAAHGGTYDPLTNTVIIMGDNRVTQLDLNGTILADIDLGTFGQSLTLDQGTVDGNGHLFAASNTGHLLFIDYADALGGSGDLDTTDPDFFLDVQFLDTNLDDIAPLVGPGSTGGGGEGVPEPVSAVLGLMGLGALNHSLRRRRG